ncbi:MAG: ribonuclease III [Defluviitaleaceae bacterium]|nr:ribonuclease III [Defluviitaleaceae bacterium]
MEVPTRYFRPDPQSQILDAIDKGQAAPHNYSPLNLAYIGDAVYSLLVRTRLVTQANRPTHALNKAATAKVKATDQSANYYKLQTHLTEEELSVLKRGRNASPATKAKSASYADYRNATGLEALFGYLYLEGQTARILELFDICWSDSNEERI